MTKNTKNPEDNDLYKNEEKLNMKMTNVRSQESVLKVHQKWNNI